MSTPDDEVPIAREIPRWDEVLTVRQALHATTVQLAASGSETPRLDAELLLAHALGIGRVELTTELVRRLTRAELSSVCELARRRARREPLQYVIGEWGFRRLTLTVDRRALIPRPETEVVVERCLALLAGRTAPRVLDVGTGSGAIALAIADEHRGTRVTGIDVSPEALALARENATRTGLPLELAERDLLAGLPHGPWHLVASNPPYVAPAEWEGLAPEVREWEPRAALVGEGATEAVARGAAAVLGTRGALVLEVAAGQAGEVSSLLWELGYVEVRTSEDLAGHERVVEGRWP